MFIGAKGRNRTDDTSIFSAVLYQLSYLGVCHTITCLASYVNTFLKHVIKSLIGPQGYAPDGNALVV